MIKIDGKNILSIIDKEPRKRSFMMSISNYNTLKVASSQLFRDEHAHNAIKYIGRDNPQIRPILDEYEDCLGDFGIITLETSYSITYIITIDLLYAMSLAQQIEDKIYNPRLVQHNMTIKG